MIEVSWQEIKDRLNVIVGGYGPETTFYGVPRGGAIVAQLTGRSVDDPLLADVILDDVIDSGETRSKYQASFPGKPFHALYNRLITPEWEYVVFPWEAGPQTDAEDSVRRILQAIGETPTREGLLDTPKRHVKYLREFLTPPKFTMTAFQNEGTDQMIVQSGIPFYSLCEHHLLPFFGTATVAYIPSEKIVGLSKLARSVEHFSRRLQNQERITQQVAELIMKELNPLGVGVSLNARHMCMEMRGVRVPGAATVTTHLAGIFQEPAVKQEFLLHVR